MHNDKDVVADTFYKSGPSSLVSGELPINFGCEIIVSLTGNAQCHRVLQNLQLKDHKIASALYQRRVTQR